MAQLASARGLGPRGRRFESFHPDHLILREMNNAEKSPRYVERIQRAGSKIGAGVLLAGLAIATWNIFDKSGDVQKAEPVTPIPGLADNTHRQLSWNMHNEAGDRWRQIKNLINTKDLDAVSLQEVNRDDFEKLTKKIPDHYMTYALADAKSSPTSGGYGNMIITKQKPKDIDSISLDGSKFWSGVGHTALGFAQDVAYADTGLDNAGKGFQADRSALALTVPVQHGSDQRDVRVITSHIAGDPQVHNDQLSKLLKFVDQQSSKASSTIFCGDLNDVPENIIPKFAEIGFITPETKGTWAGPSHKTIDYCAYKPGDTLGLGKVNVLPEKTDHYALSGIWTSRE